MFETPKIIHCQSVDHYCWPGSGDLSYYIAVPLALSAFWGSWIKMYCNKQKFIAVQSDFLFPFEFCFTFFFYQFLSTLYICIAALVNLFHCHGHNNPCSCWLVLKQFWLWSIFCYVYGHQMICCVIFSLLLFPSERPKLLLFLKFCISVPQMYIQSLHMYLILQFTWATSSIYKHSPQCNGIIISCSGSNRMKSQRLMVALKGKVPCCYTMTYNNE